MAVPTEPVQLGKGLWALLKRQDTNPIARFILQNLYILTSEKINYVELDGDSLSYLPAGRRQAIFADGSYNPVGRQSGKPGKTIRSLFPKIIRDQFTDEHFEQFANLVKASNIAGRADFEMVDGEDIRHWYHEAFNMRGSESLSSSCMRYSRCQNFLHIYKNNHKRIKMLILRDRSDISRIHGRALVWYVPGFDKPIMDRVYGTLSTQNAFRAYAIEHGWIYRMYNTYTNPTAFVEDGKPVFLRIVVALPNFKYDKFPYMDTMSCFHYGCGVFSNQSAPGWNSQNLHDTDGRGRPNQPYMPVPNVRLKSGVWYLSSENAEYDTNGNRMPWEEETNNRGEDITPDMASFMFTPSRFQKWVTEKVATSESGDWTTWGEGSRRFHVFNVVVPSHPENNWITTRVAELR